MLFLELAKKNSVIENNFFIGSSRYFPDCYSRVYFAKNFDHDRMELPILSNGILFENLIDPDTAEDGGDCLGLLIFHSFVLFSQFFRINAEKFLVRAQQK